MKGPRPIAGSDAQAADDVAASWDDVGRVVAALVAATPRGCHLARLVAKHSATRGRRVLCRAIYEPLFQRGSDELEEATSAGKRPGGSD